MDPVDAFSSDYFAARDRFRESVAGLGWSHEAIPIEAPGPNGESLTIDVASSSTGDAERVLVLSSGVHGVEGFFGSAVQLAALASWREHGPPNTKCVLLHGLNPSGFAWRRRFDEHNVDPNRNCLIEGEKYEGVSDGFVRLDPFLNPRTPPSRWEPFTLKAMWLIARYGLPTLKQSIAAGQYEFPQGLFFGGSGPSTMCGLLDEHLPRWLAGARRVAHLDFHTGLGPKGTWKLLIDYPPGERRRKWLGDWFGADSFEDNAGKGIAYDAKGGFGRWCTHRGLAPDYLFVCAEFGTYRPVPVLAGLRAENRAHHWGTPSQPTTEWAKRRLVELFCPRDERWRASVIRDGLELVARAERGLSTVELPEAGA